jgi:hypothetical protein
LAALDDACSSRWHRLKILRETKKLLQKKLFEGAFLFSLGEEEVCSLTPKIWQIAEVI